MSTPRTEVRKLRRGFTGLVVLGVLLVVAGVVGLVYVGVATLTTMLLFGWLLLIGGVIGLVHAVQSRHENYFWPAVLIAALYLAAGIVILRRPEVAAATLTMFAALLFLAGGLFRLVGALVARGPQFGWALVQGALGVLLGVLVLAGWPSSSVYVIGCFFSLALLFDGLGLIATGLGGRQIVGLVTDSLAPEGEPDADPGPPPSRTT
ncbi:HdeD family acid-resistance protein [Streptomyces sp. JNUCC 64]